MDSNKAINKGGFKSFLKKMVEAQEFTVIVPFIVLMIVATILNPVFVKPANLASIARFMSIWGLLAIGETFIIITGEIDISIGSMTSFCAMFFAYLMTMLGLHWALALIIMMATAVILSMFNGFCIIKLKMPAFIVTIAMLYICKGLARFVSYAKPINVNKAPLAQDFLNFGTSKVMGTGWGFIFFVVIIVIAAIVLKKSKFGHQVVATGDSLMAARISGVNTDRIKMITFIISGLMVSLVAMFLVGRETVANPNNGDGWEMQVIAACSIGAISLDGGSGSMVGTFFGVAFMAALTNALNMLAVNPNWQTITVGIVIVLAVVLDITRRNKKFGAKI